MLKNFAGLSLSVGLVFCSVSASAFDLKSLSKDLEKGAAGLLKELEQNANKQSNSSDVSPSPTADIENKTVKPPVALDKPCSRQAQLDAPDRFVYALASQCMVDLGDASEDQKTLGWGSHGLGFLAIYGESYYDDQGNYVEHGQRKADILTGIEYLEEAASRGNNRSQFLLARVYSDFWGRDLTRGIDVTSAFSKGRYRARAEDFKNFDAAEKNILLLSNNPLVSEGQKRWLEQASPMMAEWKASLNTAGLAQSQWQSYRDREKTLLEQVLNYSDTGNIEGLETKYWVASAEDKCSLEVEAEQTFNASKLDFRQLNQTAWRAAPTYLQGNAAFLHLTKDSGWAVEIRADDVMFYTSSDLVDVQRLQKAWTLAFEECPGKKSAF